MREAALRALVVLACLWPALAIAQGFATMGEDATGYAPVRPETVLQFPQDHGPHDAFRIEWWYVTATLTGEDGADYGAQWTLFRYRARPGDDGQGWDSPTLWMGHAAATSAGAHHAAERLGRGGVGQAGAVLDPAFEAWIDDWSLVSTAPPGADPFDALRMRARDAAFAFDLALTAQGPLVLHGQGGFSVKSDRGHASHYYSQPAYRAEGTLTLDGRSVAVTGQAWLDREWSSQPLDADQVGWDWFSLSLNDGRRLMLYHLRMADGGRTRTTGTLIAADGAATPLDDATIEVTPAGFETVAGRRTPVRWRIRLPDHGFDLETRPLNPQAWNPLSVPYWEGPVIVEGSHAGRGYLEMTGY